MDGFLVMCHVQFTAEESGRQPNEGVILNSYPVQFCETDHEARKLCENSNDVFEKVKQHKRFPGGILSHVTIIQFVHGFPACEWQPK